MGKYCKHAHVVSIPPRISYSGFMEVLKGKNDDKIVQGSSEPEEETLFGKPLLLFSALQHPKNSY